MSKLSVTIANQVFEVEIPLLDQSQQEFDATVDGQTVTVGVSSLQGPEELEWITVDGKSYEIEVDKDLHWLRTGPRLYPMVVRDLDAIVSRPVSGDSRVKAPIPGLITAVFVKKGDEVEAGQPLLVLEAMKMENTICAPRSGKVGCIQTQQGKTVTLGDVLAEIV